MKPMSLVAITITLLLLPCQSLAADVEVMGVTFPGEKVIEGRTLKLLSGTMMLGLGLVLLFAPNLLDNMATAIVVLGIAIVVTALVSGADRWSRRHRKPVAH